MTNAPGEVRVTLARQADMGVVSGQGYGRAVVISPEERFAMLFEQTHQPLLAYAVRRVAYPADAADVVAETFLVAWRRLDDVPPGAQARPWLFGVARRVLANLYRTERRRTAWRTVSASRSPTSSDPGRSTCHLWRSR